MTALKGSCPFLYFITKQKRMNKKLMTAIGIAIGTIALGSAFYLGSRVNAEPGRLEEIQARISVLSGELSQLGTKWQELENEQTELTTVANSKRAEIAQLQQEAEGILGL